MEHIKVYVYVILYFCVSRDDGRRVDRKMLLNNNIW